ncbi:MAG: hypothetical protein NTW20_16050 [Rhodobacterales bacterium]|nr:hypothetical protein [Rhodobacterales bacterium]
MTDPDQTPDETWQTILKAAGSGRGTALLAFAIFYKDLQKYEVRHPFFAPAFLRAADLVIRAALCGQDAVAKALCAELFPLACQVAEAPPGTELDILATPNLAAVAIFSLAKAMHWTEFLPDASGPSLEVPLTRLAAMTRFSDGERESTVLALLLHERHAAARVAAASGKLPPFFAAFLTGDPATLWPAWRDRFPAEARADAVFWHQMLFAVCLLAGPDRSPPDWLRAQVS